MIDGEILKFAELARTRPFVIRSIEFMPIGQDDGWRIERVVTTEEIVETINAYVPLLPIP